jgi:UDP-N-acetylglucosamine--N-acetylmuramyl-(pentapeptide) pyrophosphoryl-undecaprenol N-acetylglucosamine transferase
MTTVLMAGGGTGGHVFPMLAVGDALRAAEPEARIVYVGTGRGLETKLVPESGGELELLEVLPLRGGGLGGFVRGAARAVAVLPEARALVRRLDPDVVFSVGGYAAGPVTLAAWSARVPVTLLEPNAVIGFTNRLLAPFIRRAYAGFPETADAFRGDTALFTGVPLRRRFEPAPYRPADPPRILVTGGSQGAKALNETVPHAVAACLRAGLRLVVEHQTGRDKDAEVRRLYDELGIAAHVEVKPFIDDVAAALARADLVIERAGAGSCAETCAVGRPAILVPYPFAADDHQRRNAQSLERAGAAICIPQPSLTADRLTAELHRLLADPALRADMAAKSAARGRPSAAASVAQDLLAIASFTRRHEDTKVSRRDQFIGSRKNKNNLRAIFVPSRLRVPVGRPIEVTPS